MKPRELSELSEAIQSSKSPVEVIGLGSKRALGRPVTAKPLDLSAFKGVIAYEPEELILECGAATRMDEIEKLLAKKNQMLAFEPPDFSELLGSEQAGSMGGALACNLAGPRRVKAGAARDHILGLTGVNGQGEIIRAGARVVKNVTGYDVPRLMAGSYGTLMAFTSVIFKVLPKPETEKTLLVKCQDSAEALRHMTTAMATGAEVSAAAFVPRQGVYLRLEGIAASVTFRRDLLQQKLGLSHDTLPEKPSRQLWADLRDVVPLHQHTGKNIWRISVPPSDAPRLIGVMKTEDYFCDWAGGLIWLALEAGLNPRQHLRSGTAMLLRAAEKTRANAEIFHPQEPALAALSARVKQAFDPRGLLNPGRMYKEF